MDLNSITLGGRLTRDAEVKSLPKGTILTSFDIANNRGWGDKERVLFAQCNVWGDQGTKIQQYLVKGKEVGVTGELEVQTWVGADGKDHWKLVIKCNDIVLKGGGGSGGEAKPKDAYLVNDVRPNNVEDIPF